MRTELLEKLKKYHRAYDWLEKHGYNPIGVCGKYVIAGGEVYKTFVHACVCINPNWDNEEKGA